MEEAEILCDRLAIMDHGHILEMGTVDQLISKRFHERAVRFDAIDGLDDAELAGLAAVSSVKHDEDAVLLYSRDVAATVGALLTLTEARGLEPQNLGIRRATLEDVFLDLTGRALRD
jgi:ABC-2 type transport system ATP-binding protein